METRRVEIPAHLRAGHPKSEIAKLLNVSRMTVHRVAVRLKNGGDLKDQHRSSRPRYLKRLSARRAFERNPKFKMTALANKKNFSVATVSRAVGKACGTWKGPWSVNRSL